MKTCIKQLFPLITLTLSLLFIDCHSKYYSPKSVTNFRLDTAKVLSPLPVRLTRKTREFLFNYQDSSYAYGSSCEVSYEAGVNPDSLDKENEEWTIYYKKGNIKARGKYQYSNHHQCCYAGPCTIPYTYKSGKWTYWYENGQKMCEGIYTRDTFIIRNSCGERVMVFSGITDSSWKFWDEFGKTYSPDKNYLQRLQTADAKNSYRGKYTPGRQSIDLENQFFDPSFDPKK